ncbi:hypothetical protein BC829DRAFT_400456 [Chytridium lagenaria]|nr:hypothetical protein BC829DRAFT_400456 [Chytridium lagenaria]
MSIDRVKFSVLDDVGLGDLFDHVPKPVLAHCLEMISENVSEDDMMEEDGELRLSEEKVCRVIGEELLKTSEDSWSLEGFMDIFVTSIPELFKPRLEHLSGLYIIDHGPDSRANIIYFPKTSLPMNPKDRLEQMFEQKRKWTEEEMMPYVDDLGKGNRADLEVVLLKHSRTFKVGGMTYYASKAR